MMQYVTNPGTQGICPTGWHLPTDAEWCILEQFLDPAISCGTTGWSRGIDGGGKLKETGTSHWFPPNTGATNSSGFTALPGADCTNGTFASLGYNGNFWSSSENSTSAWHRTLRWDFAQIARDYNLKTRAFSARCLKDVTPPTWSCGDPLNDSRDGQSYATVQIGTQCWMAENMNIGTMISGTNDQTNNSTIEKYCYDNNTANCDVYGGLYQWNEMMQYLNTPGTQGICPTGWHLPTDAEWCTLEQFVDATISCSATGWRGVDGGGKLKEAGTSHWNSPNTGASNSSGFTALPGGFRSLSSSFVALCGNGYFWSSSESVANAWGRNLSNINAQVNRYDGGKANGYSTRCLKDITPIGWSCGQPLPVTHAAGDIAPVNKAVNYGTVETSLTGSNKCWITQNLGSDRQALSATDNTEESAGWYWQFNRKQGYKHDGTIRTPNTTWITSIDENSDWLIANDPCAILLGTAWRLPTFTEWNNADMNEGWNNYNDTYASVLKLHAAGYLDYLNATLYWRGSNAYYWSSTQVNNPGAWCLDFYSGGSYMNNVAKTNGFVSRCLKD